MADPTIEYCVLNVSANPHPVGVYVELLRDAVGHFHNYAGSDVATITTPRKRRPGYYQGRVVCWTDIDLTDPAIDKRTLVERTLAELNLDIPPNIGLNGKVFIYTFRERDHKLFVETKNEVGKRLSPKLVGRIFQYLFSAEVQPAAPDVEVTVVPQEDTLARILALPGLKKLKIHMVRSNPDDINSEVERVLAEMDAMGAKSQEITVVKAPKKPSLVLTDRLTAQARAGDQNGFVEGVGEGNDGKDTRLNTKEHPLVIKSVVPEERTFVADALQVAQKTSI